MVLAAVAALLVGVIVGIIALAWFAFFVGELVRRRVNKFAPNAALALLVGSAIAGAPIGHYVVSDALWAWYVVGEAVAFIPGSLYTVYWYLTRVIRRRQ